MARRKCLARVLVVERPETYLLIIVFPWSVHNWPNNMIKFIVKMGEAILIWSHTYLAPMAPGREMRIVFISLFVAYLSWVESNDQMSLCLSFEGKITSKKV